MAVGRNRAFNTEQVIQSAMSTFWELGYSGTSLSDLTERMGINKSSLYGTFKNKETLFVTALNEYTQRHGKPYIDILFNDQRKSPIDRIKGYLMSVIELVSDTNCPKGCLVANSTCELNGSTLPDSVVREIHSINEQSMASFRQFFAQYVDGVNAQKVTTSYADYLMSLQFGLAVMAKNGSSKAALTVVAERAMPSFSVLFSSTK